MKRISLTILLFGLLVAATASAEDVYRWVDSEGITRYGRTLPPEYANKPHEILNDAGVVLRTIDPTLEREESAKKPAAKEPEKIEPLFSDREVRVRSDNLLMLRYHTEKDLMDAMNVEVSQLGYDTRLIHQAQASVMTNLRAQVNNAANRQRASMNEDEELTQKINALRQRLRRSDRSLANLKQREAVIRATFDEDLKRYQYLANGGAPGSFEPDQ